MTRTARAPGRVNLIGEHTDYNGGFVLPMAIDLDCRVTARPGERWVARSREFGETLDVRATADRRHWIDYVAGAAAEFGGAEPLEIEIESDVPPGAGLASSAALLVALGLAIGGEMDPGDLVRRAHRVETEFLGLPCGIMDQWIAVHARAGTAMLLDCRSGESQEVRLPDASLVILDSGVKHDLVESAYANRVRECRAACEAIGVESLREVDDLHGLPPRARHVVSENGRVLAFAESARLRDLARMGELMLDSHASLRDDYEVSCAELDFLVERAAGFPGVYGARMTGGGFGGSAIALVESGCESAFEEFITQAYAAHWKRAPGIYRVRPSAGASLIA